MKQDEAKEGIGRIDAEESQKQSTPIRRPGHGDLRVASDDNRVAVVPRVAPSPTGGLPQHHERGDFVEDVVHPVGLERGAVSGLVPAGIGGRGVKRAVNHEWEDGPPRAQAPEHEAADAGTDNQREPEQRVPDGGAVAALKQLAHLLPRHGRGIPRRLGQAFFNGPRRVLAH